MKVSIIVPAFKRANLLKWGLLSLSRQTIPFDFETIVLNDGIPDETEELCSKYKDKLNIKYIFTGQRNMSGNFVWRIPGFAINIGVKQSEGDVIVLCCAEMFHVNDTISRITEVFNSSDINKTIVIPLAKDDNSRFLNRLIVYYGEYSMDDYNAQPNLDNVRFPFFMAMKKKDYMDIGGYDEDFTGTDFDDADLVHRLVQNGCQYLETEARVVHLWHERLPMSPERRVRYEYNMRLYKEREDVIVRNVGREWGVL